MGFVCLPVSAFLYWLMLHYKTFDPFPKNGVTRLVIAGTVSAVLSALLSVPVNVLLLFLRLGPLQDPSVWHEAIRGGSETLAGLIGDLSAQVKPSFPSFLIGMFFSAGLLEEGVKYLACRVAIRKKDMVRTWMDSVIAFAVVGITFEFLENIVFGTGSDLLGAVVRALGSAHFVFGVIMGWFYGKYLVTGQTLYHVLSLCVPVLCHTLINALMASMEMGGIFNALGVAAGMSQIVAVIVTVILVLRWQKRHTLDAPVLR